MNVVKWLEEVRKLDELITAKLAERSRLRQLATDISPKPMDGMPHGGSGKGGKMENAIINLIDLENEINRLIDRYVDRKKEIVAVLEKLPSREYGIMHRYYIRGMTLERIADDIGYSVRQVSRIKKKSLKNLEDVLECHP